MWVDNAPLYTVISVSTPSEWDRPAENFLFSICANEKSIVTQSSLLHISYSRREYVFCFLWYNSKVWRNVSSSKSIHDDSKRIPMWMTCKWNSCKRLPMEIELVYKSIRILQSKTKQNNQESSEAFLCLVRDTEIQWQKNRSRTFRIKLGERKRKKYMEIYVSLQYSSGNYMGV